MPPEGSPERIRSWWFGLDERTRADFLAHRAGEIGGLDGLPSVVRDRANRAVLDDYIDRTGDTDAIRLRTEIDLDGALLLYYRPPSTVGGTDTRVAISFGDPDHAVNTTVFVPGTASNTRDVKYLRLALDFLRRLRIRADAQTEPGNTATVYWLGYKSPDRLVPDAMSASYARDGHPALTRFLKGLRAANRVPDRGDTTLIGYSYGSVVVGHAAAAADLTDAVDTILVAGSPGLGRHVRSVADLRFDPARVLAAASPVDPVVHTPALVHGPNPAHPSFRARRVATGGVGHLGYGTEGSLAFLNTVYITLGLLDRVTAPPAWTAGGPAARLGDWFGGRVGRRSTSRRTPTAGPQHPRVRHGARRPPGRSGPPRG
ncbi:alpha/beta hydrolase [Marinactinospora rubrisoli]|uniref:Alpha/beta hydrolase n=1 Tax=Marinactinospora rubrisoli TaxID=2715399 RepID=A0ABW2K8M6_9ACTN